MYTVWNDTVPLPNVSALESIQSERVTIKPFEPEKDGYVFLHGVALANYKGRLYCSWAHNKVQENSEDEEVNYAVSDDNGKTWSNCIKGNCAPANGVAVSHGAFLVHDDSLYFFAPQFKGQMGAEMMKVGGYVFDEEKQRFRYAGVVLDERFWPMCEPTPMDNGNYIMPGIYVGADSTTPDNTAAVAISHGSDVLHWDMVKLRRSEAVRVWGECSVVVEGAICRLYCREHSGKRVVLYAESSDYGTTWSELDVSNLPMIDSKPYAGTLSTGQHYLLCSCAKDIADRNPLTIALTKKGESTFSKLYSIDSGKVLSYPYAVEYDGKLYVAYSSATEHGNRNRAELAIIDIRELQV